MDFTERVTNTLHFPVICETLSSVCVSICLTSAVLGDIIFSQQLLQMSSEILERQGFSTGMRHDTGSTDPHMMTAHHNRGAPLVSSHTEETRPEVKTGLPAIISSPCPQSDYFDRGWF